MRLGLGILAFGCFIGKWDLTLAILDTPLKLHYLKIDGHIGKGDEPAGLDAERDKPEDFILAIAAFQSDIHRVDYLRQPFQREPDFGVPRVNYDLDELPAKAEKPG